MQCYRCRGLMVYEEFFAGTGDSLPWSYKGWRCLDCGEIIDPVILLNRENALSQDVTKREEVLS